MVSHATAANQSATVITDSDGRYRFDRLTPGRANVSALLTVNGTAVVTGQEVTVSVATPPLDLVLERGPIDLSVTVEERGKSIEFADVYVFEGAVTAKNAADLNRLMQTEAGLRRVGAAGRGSPALLPGLRPGRITVCAVPVGQADDPRTASRIQEEPGALPAFCQQPTIAAEPTAQQLTIRVQ